MNMPRAFIKNKCEEWGVDIALAEVFLKGGEGGVEIAQKLCETIDRQPSAFKMIYELDLPIKEKIEIINKELYGGKNVEYTTKALNEIKRLP